MPELDDTTVSRDLASRSPAGLGDAFLRYERALRDDDIDVLDELFAIDPDVVRIDPSTTLIGHDRISGFRRNRPTPAARTVVATHPVVVSDDVVVVVAETAAADRGPGQQTQVWVRTPGGWRIRAAHVTPAAATVDRATWRVHSPRLVPASGRGPLEGLRIAVKDLFDVAGHRRGAGVPAVLAEGEPAPVHAPAVDRLLAVGGTLVGITHCDELAFGLEGDNPHYGMPRNPAAPGRIPGGSSSGAAVAVAGREADVALSTDTAGSIRVPASYQGLWGLRSTHGSVSTAGMSHLAPSFDAVGWITRDRATLAKVLDAQGIVATSRGVGFAVAPALSALATAGVQEGMIALAGAVDARILDLGPHFDGWFTAFRLRQAKEAWGLHGDWLRAHPTAVSAPVRSRFDAGSDIPDDDDRSAAATLSAARVAVLDALGDDILLLPSAAGAAPTPASADGARVATLRLNALASLAGLPALSVPLLTDAGLPVGVTLVGGPRRDRDLLDAARDLVDALAASPHPALRTTGAPA